MRVGLGSMDGLDPPDKGELHALPPVPEPPGQAPQRGSMIQGTARDAGSAPAMNGTVMGWWHGSPGEWTSACVPPVGF